MNNLQIFNSPEFGDIRCIEIDGEPWMAGKDIATALGYSNPRDALAKHVDPEDKNTVAICDGTSGNPNMTFINESGLYSLILSSKLPTAKRFKHWVTSEVLPSIRKHGAYVPQSTPQRQLSPDDYLRAASIVANCRNERLPYVLGFLEQGGFSIRKVESTKLPEPKLAQVINMAIDEYGLTVVQIGNLTGVPREQIYRYKKGAIPQGKRAAHMIQVISDTIAQIDQAENQ